MHTGHLIYLVDRCPQTGVVSGSVVVVRPRLDGQEVSEETVRAELTAIYAERLEVSDEEEEQEMAREDPQTRESQVPTIEPRQLQSPLSSARQG